MALSFFGKPLSRIDELRKVLSKDPASRQFLQLADEYRKEGKLREAIETLERGLSYNPASVAGHVALGRLLLNGGRLDDALLSFQAALRLDRENLVATRQIAEIYLRRGDKVEGVKKLKLYRGLNPGDREVSELISRLDEDIGFVAPKPPAPPARPAAPEPPPTVILSRAAARTPTASIPRFAPPPDFRGPAYPRPPATGLGGTPGVDAAVTAPVPPLPPMEQAPGPSSAPPLQPLPSSPAPTPAPPGRRAAAEPEVFELTFDSTGRRPQPPAPPFPAEAPAFEADGAGVLEAHVAGAVPPVEDEPEATVIVAPLGEPEPRPRDASPWPPALAAGVPPVPAVTEALADLFAAQGHLEDARTAYLDLKAGATDAARARRLEEKAEALASRLAAITPADRLRRYLGELGGGGPEAAPDLDSTLDEVVERLPGTTATVTDFEGLAVVARGPEVGSATLEAISAELTALWKNVRRTRQEHGAGALEALVVSSEAGTVVVQGITSGYALLLKAGGSLPVGQVRYEALRGAERLRPALL